MPLYEYHDSERNCRVELFRTIAERDNVPPNLRRIVPHSFALVMPPNPFAHSHETQHTLKTLEQQIGLKELERQSGYSAATLKKVWFDEAEKPNPNELPVTADAAA